MKVLAKLFTPLLKSGIRNFGTIASSLSIGDITAKVNYLTLAIDTTITLPEFDSTESISFMLKITQDSTGGHSLTINKNDGTAAINLNEFDFSSGTAGQKCWVTVLWDGADLCYTATNYVD